MWKEIIVKGDCEQMRTCEVCPFAIFEEDGEIRCESEQYKECRKES